MTRAFNFGAKIAADPRPADVTDRGRSAVYGQLGSKALNDTAAQVNSPGPAGGQYVNSNPGDNDLRYDLGQRRWVSSTERNHDNRATNLQHDVAAYENIAGGLKNESRGDSGLGLAASMGINAAGNALGAPALAGVANAGLTGLRGAADAILAGRMKYTQTNSGNAQQSLQQFKQPWEAKQTLAPAATPKAVTPVLGKSGSCLAFGAKLAASTCSPCDMPNSPANKKHMTGASPAVTEAGEKSEEIGKPEVTETEHSEAEAKQPEEGIKSAANPKAFGQMFSSLMQTPAQAGQKAMLAARSNLKIKPGA